MGQVYFSSSMYKVIQFVLYFEATFIIFLNAFCVMSRWWCIFVYEVVLMIVMYDYSVFIQRIGLYFLLRYCWWFYVRYTVSWIIEGLGILPSCMYTQGYVCMMAYVRETLLHLGDIPGWTARIVFMLQKYFSLC